MYHVVKAFLMMSRYLIVLYDQLMLGIDIILYESALEKST